MTSSSAVNCLLFASHALRILCSMRANRLVPDDAAAFLLTSVGPLHITTSGQADAELYQGPPQSLYLTASRVGPCVQHLSLPHLLALTDPSSSPETVLLFEIVLGCCNLPTTSRRLPRISQWVPTKQDRTSDSLANCAIRQVWCRLPGKAPPC